MRRQDEDIQDATMRTRVLTLLRSQQGKMTFAAMCHALGCDDRKEVPGGAEQPERARALMNTSARRERSRLQRVLRRGEAEGLIVRSGDAVLLREAGDC
jgi:cell division inhibitor SulA